MHAVWQQSSNRYVVGNVGHTDDLFRAYGKLSDLRARFRKE